MKYIQPTLIEALPTHGGRRPGAGRPTNKSKKLATTVRLAVAIKRSHLLALTAQSQLHQKPIGVILRALLDVYLEDFIYS